MATDNLSVSEGNGAQASAGGVGGRRYKKKDQKRISTQSADSSNGSTQERDTNQSDADIQRIKLNRLSDYEVDDVKMANVFGGKPDAQKKPVSSSMRLNPLYDQNGTVEVSTDQAQAAKLGDNTSQDSGSQDDTLRSGRSKKGTYKRPKKPAEEEEDEPAEDVPQEPKINYSKNFRFGKPSADGQNGAAGGKNGVKKLTTFGVVMPSRVKQNTIPKNQLSAAGGTSQYALGAQTGKSKADVEAANRRHEIRRRWRYVIILVLIILVFGLILTVVLYFATRAPSQP